MILDTSLYLNLTPSQNSVKTDLNEITGMINCFQKGFINGRWSQESSSSDGLCLRATFVDPAIATATSKIFADVGIPNQYEPPLSKRGMGHIVVRFKDVAAISPETKAAAIEQVAKYRAEHKTKFVPPVQPDTPLGLVRKLGVPVAGQFTA